MKTNVAQIKERVNKQRSELKNAYNVENIGIFGSVARGDNIETSDIDILVKFSKPVGMFKFIALEEHLSHLFGTKVDLVTDRALKPSIKNEILQEVIYV